MIEFLRRIAYLFSRRRRHAELEDEMAFHREMAAQAGRRNFGNSLSLREQAYAAWGWTWLDRLGQDVHYALRTLRRSPGFTATAVLVLSIGIGANVAAFTLFNMFALQSIPVRDPASLIRLQRRSPENINSEMPYRHAMFFRDHATTLTAVIATSNAGVHLDHELEPVKALFVTSNYFQELGVSAAYGRLLGASDGVEGAPPVAVLGHRFWQLRFHADPGVIGSVIHVNGKPVTVVGIEPYGFPGLDAQTGDFWLPISQQPYFMGGSNLLTDMSTNSVHVWGRLAHNATRAAVEQELLGLTNELRRQYPADIWKGEYVRSDPGGHFHVMEPEMLQVAAFVGLLTLLILAVACANLGGLQLARGVAREREMNIRLAVGANAMRIFRQLITESLVLAMLGSIAGTLLAWGCLRVALVLTDAPPWLSAAPDSRVLFFLGGVMLLASVLFGFAPSLQIARRRQNKAIARQVFVGGQIAVSSILLILASLLVHAALHALYTNPGFGYERALSVDPQLGQHGYTPAAAQDYLKQLRTQVQALPGVASVSLVKLSPLGHTISRIDTEVNGKKIAIFPNWIDSGYFQTMNIPLLTGRNFLPGEKKTIIISRSLARRQWPGENPLGKLYGDYGTVVGIAGDARVNSLNDGSSVELYWPAQPEDMPDMMLLIKASGDPGVLQPRLKVIVENLNPQIFPEIRLLTAAFRQDMKPFRMVATAISFIGLIAVSLAGVGILGLVAYTVSQRSRELAIRMALGATRKSLASAVLIQFRWPVSAGLLLGILSAAGLSMLLGKVLFGVSNLDPASYLTAIAILVLFVGGAFLLPVHRALGMHLGTALHND